MSRVCFKDKDFYYWKPNFNKLQIIIRIILCGMKIIMGLTTFHIYYYYLGSEGKDSKAQKTED